MNPLPALCLGLQLFAYYGPEEHNPAVLAPRAEAILRANCYGCHGKDGTAKGRFDYVLDRDRLVARGKISAGDSAKSELYQRIQYAEMPPRSQTQRPTVEEIALLGRWIDAGAPAVARPTAPRVFLADEEVQRLILADLQQLPTAQQRFYRYFSLVPLWNADRSAAELEMVRQGLSKLLNSLSWHPRVTRPQAINPEETIYRIDLRAYQWNAHRWDLLVAAYPYRFGVQTAASRQLVTATGSDWYCLRADWFVATASRPPLYQDLLQLPFTDRDLERQLRVDALANIEEETAVRAGFNDSGVSRNNRILERHDAAFGAYWRSYDFSDNTERQNIFEHPLGPAPGRDSFTSAGGEIIFHLPNGLHGYLLVNRDGRRIDRAPIEIVSDPRRTDRAVETGVSCFSCHVRGFIPKADQVRAHVEKNAQAFSKADVATVKALYLPEARLRALVADDNVRYEKAVKSAGVRLSDEDPISTVALIHEGTLDAARAAAELGTSTESFLQALTRSTTLTRGLGTLRVKQGTVPRQTFLAALPELVREFRLDDSYRDRGGTITSSEQPFSGHSEAITCCVLSPDGKWALSASNDRTIRLWAVPIGKQEQLFDDRCGGVFALAFSPDQKRFASAGKDRTIRLWDVITGKELRLLKGHTATVRTLVFSPDGKRLLSGGEDRTLRLWNVETGVELRTLAGHTGTVTASAFAPNGGTIASGSHDHSVRLWDAATGAELLRFTGHTQEVYAVAISPDGRLLASGGNDRIIRLWSVKDGKQLRVCDGHTNSVIKLCFAPDGKALHSAASQYQKEDRIIRTWDVETGKESGSLAGETGLKISCVSFSADGRFALSGGAEGTLKLWKVGQK